jgi:hypothetical protein
LIQFADVLLQGLYVLVGASPYLFVRQPPKPPLNLVEPGAAGGREVHVEARVRGRPSLDGRRLVGGGVVADQVHIQNSGHLPDDPDQELPELHGPVASLICPMTSPVAVLGTANRVVTPPRT